MIVAYYLGVGVGVSRQSRGGGGLDPSHSTACATGTPPLLPDKLSPNVPRARATIIAPQAAILFTLLEISTIYSSLFTGLILPLKSMLFAWGHRPTKLTGKLTERTADGACEPL